MTWEDLTLYVGQYSSVGMGPGLHKKKKMNWVLVFISPSLLFYRAAIKYTFVVTEVDIWGWKRKTEAFLVVWRRPWALVFDLEFEIPLIFIASDS